MPTGKVKWFNASKGYGFIEMDEGRDVFVHYTAIQVPGFGPWTKGQVVNFEVVDSPRVSRRACDPCWLRATSPEDARGRQTPAQSAAWGRVRRIRCRKGAPLGDRWARGERRHGVWDRRGGRIAYARHGGARLAAMTGRRGSRAMNTRIEQAQWPWASSSQTSETWSMDWACIKGCRVD